MIYRVSLGTVVDGAFIGGLTASIFPITTPWFWIIIISWVILSIVGHEFDTIRKETQQ